MSVCKHCILAHFNEILNIKIDFYELFLYSDEVLLLLYNDTVRLNFLTLLKMPVLTLIKLIIERKYSY